MFCTKCGVSVADEARFCSACGASLDKPRAFPRFRASIDDIQTLKHLSASDWADIAAQFREWRKGVTLTAIGRMLGDSSAWDNYYAGYSEGFEAAINRVFGLDAQALADIEEIERETGAPWRRG